MAPLEGFQEKGAPEAWDMAVGTVRGYRWWNVHMFFVRRGSVYDRYTGVSFRNEMGQPGSFGHNPMNPSPWVPCYDRSSVTGMHGGTWKRDWAVKDGWHTAVCPSETVHKSALLARIGHPGKHAVPDPECGCGFWAYWNRLSSTDFASHPWVAYERNYGYTVTVPLAGVVEGSGRTIIGERGFRAERVRITDLAMSLDSKCVIYEDKDEEEYYQGGVPGPAGNLVLPFLAQRLQVTPPEIMDAFVHAVTLAIGTDFTWHPSPAAVLRDTKPDENYGEKAA